MLVAISEPTILPWRHAYRRAIDAYRARTIPGPNRSLLDYVASQPFPVIDTKDPAATTKITWDEASGTRSIDDASARREMAVGHTARRHTDAS